MANLTGPQRARYVQTMFSQIAGRYDILNRLMTGGMDVRWRRDAIRRTQLQPGERLLDLGSGTGDLAREALRQQPAAQVVAADFTLNMMLVGKRHGPLPWLAADALRLPFPDHSFDAIVSGFLMRNVGDLPAALLEQVRVLKPGGRLVILETTRPTRTPLWPLVWAHLHIGIPVLGMLVARKGSAYQYLRASTESFLLAEDLAEQMLRAGLGGVGFQRRMMGTIAIHWGKK